MQGLPFLSFVEEGGCPYNSQDWLSAAEDALQEWRAAEEQLQAARASKHAMRKLGKDAGGCTCICNCCMLLVYHVSLAYGAVITELWGAVHNA
jgi:hypothetical protein